MAGCRQDLILDRFRGALPTLKGEVSCLIEDDEIPWYLRGRILEQHCIVYAEDPDDLDFWLYKQHRIWSDMKLRQQRASVGDLLKRVRRLRPQG